MTKDRDFKELVRARSEETGETYTAARAALRPGTPPGLAEAYTTLSDFVNGAVPGKSDVVRLVLLGVFCGGGVLFEDVPGSECVRLVETLAAAAGLQEGSDFLWIRDLGQATDEEIRRLHDAVSAPLHLRPLLTVGIWNPVQLGLPRRQLTVADCDCFAVRVRVGYADRDQETRQLREAVDDRRASAVVTPTELRSALESVARSTLSEDVAAFIVDVVTATRRDERLLLGASSKASADLARAAIASAAVARRSHATVADASTLVEPVLGHRIWFHPTTSGPAISVSTVLMDAVNSANR